VPAEAEPLEEAADGAGAGDEGADEFPAVLVAVHFRHLNPILFTVLADQPDEDLQIADAPVPLQLARLGHPASGKQYFSIRFSASAMTVSLVTLR
jgi:hypothetical protein